MKIAVAGTGYVGLVTGTCLAEMGHEITCVDVVAEKIEKLNRGESPIFEAGLDELLVKNRSRMHFTTDPRIAYGNAEIVIVGVGTPEKKDGSANLSFLFAVVDQIAEFIERDCIVIVKSTVPIGTNDRVEKRLRERLAELKKTHQVDVVSNPEFLAQGTAVRDTLHPSRIVVGAENEGAAAKIRGMYAGFDAPVLTMNRRSAEMVKYASNDFLALKISYINEIANVCELVGADIECVTEGMSYDPRIGSQFLRAGIGYGGSCFPKDTKALHWLANFHNYEIKTIKAAIEVNSAQKLKLLKQALNYFGGSLAGKKVAVLGLAFKPGTDDLRDGPALDNVPLLLDEGATICAWDDVAQNNFKKVFPQIQYAETPADALKDADLCFIFTEWDAVKSLQPSDFAMRMKTPVVFDGRNCFSVPAMKSAGIEYFSIGR